MSTAKPLLVRNKRGHFARPCNYKNCRQAQFPGKPRCALHATLTLPPVVMSMPLATTPAFQSAFNGLVRRLRNLRGMFRGSR